LDKFLCYDFLTYIFTLKLMYKNIKL